MQTLLDTATKAYSDAAGITVQPFPSFGAGDTVCVHVKIQEGGKERVQRFEGVVLQVQGDSEANRTFTVRKISGGIPVERIFPYQTDSIHKVEVTRYGKVRRARLFYLRGKQGKAARIKEDMARKFADRRSSKVSTTPPSRR